MLIAVVLANLLSTIVGTWVGLKLLRASRRTKELPELLVGVALFSYAALAQGSMFVTRLLPDDTSLGLEMGLIVLRSAAYYATLGAFAAFAWRVFGSESRWRQGLFALLALAGAVTSVLSVQAEWLRLSQDATAPLLWRLGATPAYVVVFAWMSAEALDYYRRMQRRATLGLADAVVTNRFLLWGAGTGLSAPLLVGLIWRIVILDGQGGPDATASWLIMFAGFINTGVWWLTFAPPQGYLRWVRARGSSSAGS